MDALPRSQVLSCLHIDPRYHVGTREIKVSKYRPCMERLRSGEKGPSPQPIERLILQMSRTC